MEETTSAPPIRLSEKQERYVRAAREHVFNFAEGAVRSGKTLCNLAAFAAALETTPDRLHLATGVTLGTAKLVLGDCNGFGLEFLFGGRCRWGKYLDNPALIVSTATGEKTVLFAGGGKSDSYRKIRGSSFGLWIATEINKHYLSEDETCFVQEALNRQLAAKVRRVYWDFNPDAPSHLIYRNYVDSYRQRGLDVNYQHFTLADNPVLTAERRREIESQYLAGSVAYRRWILGERCVAEGLIFPDFADRPAAYCLPEPPSDLSILSVGVDFGGTDSRTAFVLSGIRRNFRGIAVLDACRLPAGKGVLTPAAIEDALVQFLLRIRRRFGRFPRYVFCDSEAQYLINGVRSACRAAQISVQVSDCRKVPIQDRILCKQRLMALGRWAVLSDCRQVIDSTAGQQWDPMHPDARLDNGTCDIDTADAEEYSWSYFIGKSLLEPKNE